MKEIRAAVGRGQEFREDFVLCGGGGGCSTRVSEVVGVMENVWNKSQPATCGASNKQISYFKQNTRLQFYIIYSGVGKGRGRRPSRG